MSTPITRQQMRFARLQATARAAAAATLEAARLCNAPREAARLAAIAYRMQTCHRSARLIVHRPQDDAPWTSLSAPCACFCRWCMTCERLRARTVRRHVAHVLATIWHGHPSMRASMLTLSSKNRPLPEAKAMVDDHLAALERYYRLRDVARSHYGALHAIELAIRADGREVGVHSHHLQLIDDAVMAPGRYLDIQGIKARWRAALRVDYLPLCDIRAAKAGADDDIYEAVRGAVREAAKYCLKPLSLLSAPPHDLFGRVESHAVYIDPEIILHVSRAIRGRRLLRFSGLWKAAQAQLRATTELDGETPPHAIPG